MTGVMQDPIALRQLRPPHVAEYLSSTGWTQVRGIGDRATAWQRLDERTGRTFEVLLPLDPNLDDYVARMADVLEALTLVENRSAGEIWIALTTFAADVLRAQLDREDSEDGTIPLVDGSRAVVGIRELFYSAAAAERQPRPTYPSLSGVDLNKMLNHARLGQTQRGSFVLSVVSRLPAQHTLPGIEPPERRIMRRVHSALLAVKRAGLKDSNAAFEAEVHEGVSSNLCFALDKLAAHSRASVRGVHFTFEWSWMHPVAPDIPRRIDFSSQLVRRIAAGGEHLKATEPVRNFALVGRVVGLHMKGDEETAEGEIEIEGMVQGHIRTVRLVLAGEDHELAKQVYKTPILVFCEGELLKHGQQFRLLTARNFTKLPMKKSERDPDPDPEQT